MVEKKSEKPFIIVEIAGGLGNQMFQFAFYLKLKKLRYPCRLYYDNSQRKHNGYELQKVFGVEADFATEDELNRLMDREKDFLSRLRRKLTGHRPSFYWEHEKGYAFKPEMFQQQKPVYLQGCWLSEKYFEDISEQIRKTFQFEAVPEAGQVAGNIIRNPYSVSIHIRRGDYVGSGIHRNLDYEAYLDRAIHLIRRRMAEDDSAAQPEFFVFSDDKNYAYEALRKFSATNRVYFPENKEAYADMYLMSLCRYNIIANSTFSWWAAWLNRNPDKMVVAPKEWFTTDFLNRNNIVPESWITV